MIIYLIIYLRSIGNGFILLRQAGPGIIYRPTPQSRSASLISTNHAGRARRARAGFGAYNVIC